MKRFLQIHGVGVEVFAPDSFALGRDLMTQILEDFAYFEVPESLKKHLSFSLEANGSETRFLFPAFKTGMCRATGWGIRRVCDYGNGTTVESSFEGDLRGFIIHAGDRSLAYEALYSAMLSAIGEELDRRGFHRVHGLALEHAGKRVLIVLPTGAGKSAMAALLSRETETRIFSDESPLIGQGKVWPFPIRGALRPEVAQALGLPTSGRRFSRKLFPEKLLFSFPREKVAEPGALDFILVGRRKALPAIYADDSAVTKTAAFSALFQSGVVGLGLAQMSEYMIRADSLWKLPQIGMQRLSAFASLVKTTRTGFFDVCDDAHQNARTLQKFLSS